MHEGVFRICSMLFYITVRSFQSIVGIGVNQFALLYSTVGGLRNSRIMYNGILGLFYSPQFRWELFTSQGLCFVFSLGLYFPTHSVTFSSGYCLDVRSISDQSLSASHVGYFSKTISNTI